MEHLPFMLVNVVPHKMQRYNTQGDYFMAHGVLHVYISQDNFKEELKTLIHEIAEWGLNEIEGIPIEKVDE